MIQEQARGRPMMKIRCAILRPSVNPEEV